MLNKFTTSGEIPQHLIAGINLENANDIELFGIKKNQTVQFLQAGHVHYFEELAPKFYIQLLNKFNSDKPALEYFKSFPIPTKRKLEIYTYYCYGSLDHKPDFFNGVLQDSENFRECQNCPSLQFSGKDITIDGVALSLRDLTIIDMAAKEILDVVIADAIGVSESHLGYLKKQLFLKTKTETKLGLVMKSAKENILID